MTLTEVAAAIVDLCRANNCRLEALNSPVCLVPKTEIDWALVVREDPC